MTQQINTNGHGLDSKFPLLIRNFMDRQTLDKLAKIAIRKKPFTADDRFPPSVYYRFLYELAQYKQAKLSVVLGVCGGGCCYNLAKANSGTVVGIDAVNNYPDNIEFIKKEQSNFVFVLGDSIEIADSINMLNTTKVDVLFIDTVHECSRTLAEFKAWFPYLNSDAVVCLDDLYRTGMMYAFDYLVENYGEGYRNRLLHLGGSYEDGCFGCIFNIKKP